MSHQETPESAITSDVACISAGVWLLATGKAWFTAEQLLEVTLRIFEGDV